MIAPGAQRAAALRLAWAKLQSARGHAVWRTPEILTWEAWLTRQWRAALLRQPSSLQLLSTSQERALWESALPDELQIHANALMRAAARASQSLLELSRLAVTEEERLLARTLQQVRQQCQERRLFSLRLATPAELTFLADSEPPLVVGQPRLTELQQQLAERFWPDAQLLARPDARAAMPVYCRAQNLAAEIHAVASWCREQLQQDPNRRLLVVSLWQEPGTRTQGALLWNALAGHAPPEQAPALLAVEGGEPLHHQALVQDALTALQVTGQWLETRSLQQLLRSPYFHFGSAAECAALLDKLGEWGLARWRPVALRSALQVLAEKLPAALRMRAWLTHVQEQIPEEAPRSATAWAECFSRCLQAADFPLASKLDSQDAQRLARWSELLDEFAGLDAASSPMTVDAAVGALQRLARQSIHQAATGDTAITFTAQLQDPVAHYDGIWVMGLTENRWPLPPRPDAYVPLHAQRRCNWPESGVSQQLAQASWLLERWQSCTGNLVLSHARLEGDVTHRPSSLLSPATAWIDAEAPAALVADAAIPTTDSTMPRLVADALAGPLRGGVERLRQQQECAFHAQARWRLLALQPPQLTDGMPARLRGMLLHTVLESLWGELQEQQRLLGLSPEQQHQLVRAHWQKALGKHAADGIKWIEPAVLELETQRAVRVTERVLQLERQRAPFTVQQREYQAALQLEGTALNLRIDRIDRTTDNARILIDYKSGEADSIQLQDGIARPLQLAAYAVALGQTGMSLDGAMLLCLRPAQLGYSGALAEEVAFPGRIKSVTDWPQLVAQWQIELQQLLNAHLSGNAELAHSAQACRNCHLPAFCRRAATAEQAEEDSGDE